MEYRYAPALSAHCRRVAGWATQAAQVVEPSSAELRAIEDAALRHHWPPVLLNDGPFARLAADLCVKTSVDPATAPMSAGTTAADAILCAFHASQDAAARTFVLARILEWADIFDEQFELEALDPVSIERPNAIADSASRLRIVDAESVLRTGSKLPVFPTVAQRAIRLLLRDDADFEQVNSIVRNDQTLAVELLHAANTAAVAPRQPIASIPHAIAHIGVDAAIRLVCGACLRPVFASRNLHNLWRHSVQSAHAAEEFARQSGRVPPAEAFLAALVHDIGRLAFSLLSCEFQVSYQRLVEYGCPPLLVEKALAGSTHAEIGGELLRSWSLPPQIAEAVTSHHNPSAADAAALPSLLYITEFWTASDEDLPSRTRLAQALRTIGLPAAALDDGWMAPIQARAL